MLGCWIDHLIDQVSDVPSITFFHTFLQSNPAYYMEDCQILKVICMVQSFYGIAKLLERCIISRYISNRLGPLCYEMRKSLSPDILAIRETRLLIAKFPTPKMMKNFINEVEGNPIGESKIII